MAIFISYSHQQKEFVDKLALNLAMRNIHVWVDRWELGTGDSLIQRIQVAIKEASALLIVLSKDSVVSEWCKKELEGGLWRELEEKRVVVLPLLFEDCDIPLFLRSKVYADFRTSYDEGINATLDAIAKVTSETLGRVELPEYHTDWSLDWGEYEGRYYLRFTLFSHSPKLRYSTIAEFKIFGNDAATKRHKEYDAHGLGWMARRILYDYIDAFVSQNDRVFLLKDSFPQLAKCGFKDSGGDIDFLLTIEGRRLGEDNGKDILLTYGDLMKKILSQIDERSRKPTPEERRSFEAMLKARKN